MNEQHFLLGIQESFNTRVLAARTDRQASIPNNSLESGIKTSENGEGREGGRGQRGWGERRGVEGVIAA